MDAKKNSDPKVPVMRDKTLKLAVHCLDVSSRKLKDAFLEKDSGQIAIL